jgi:hypothetical protein
MTSFSSVKLKGGFVPFGHVESGTNLCVSNKTTFKLVHSRRPSHGQREDPHRKLEGARFSGPYTVTQVNDNGTVLVQLSKATNNGAGCLNDVEHPQCEAMIARTDHPAPE